MKVGVVGCGYVGLVSATGLAARGHDVVAVESDAARRAAIGAGVPPFHEPGLEDLLQEQLHEGRLRIESSPSALEDCSVALLAVQTPPDAAGAIDLSFLRDAASTVAGVFASAPRRRVVAVRSTVVPGTVDTVVAPLFEGTPTAAASNPEFLREGSAVDDFLDPDRVVVGCHEEWGRELMADLYRPLHADVVMTSPATAELAKYASNAFLATLISFSNEIARICEGLPGVDVEEVLGILHRDRRLTPRVDGVAVSPAILSYIKAGCGYGGSCLPKDLSALLAARHEVGEAHPLLEAVRTVNDGRAARVVDQLEERLGTVAGKTVVVMGVAFKAGTDDIRSSPGLRIADELLERGALVVVHDPLVPGSALAAYGGRIDVAESIDAAWSVADACVVTTAAPEYALLDRRLDDAGGRHPVLFDGRRALSHPDVAVGRGPVTTVPESR